jgi:hypothetical protein
MSPNPDTKFAPIIRISQITGPDGPDIATIVAIWGPMQGDRDRDYSVRGVPVSRWSITEQHKGQSYRWCLFPDYRVMLVNESNITSRKQK